MWNLLLSFVLGGLFAIFLQILFVYTSSSASADSNIRSLPQLSSFRLPTNLKQLLISPGLSENLKKKETCISLNILLQFLFQELKDSKRLRRWILKKLRLEFNDLLSQFAVSKVLRDIRIVRLDIGSQFPLIKSAHVGQVQLSENEDYFEDVEIVLDVDYFGGFDISLNFVTIIDSDACLSVKIPRISGELRIRFSRKPFTHWSFAFTEEPRINFDIDSKLLKRSLPQVVPLIITQFRRMLRKKHVLPAYRIRFTPFFENPRHQPFPPHRDLFFIRPTGCLCMSSIKCIGLNVLNAPLGHAQIIVQFNVGNKLVTMSAEDNLPFALVVKLKKLMAEEAAGLTLRRITCVKKNCREVTVVDVQRMSPAARCDLRVGDVILSINGISVHSERQAMKLLSDGSVEYDLLVERTLDSDHQHHTVSVQQNQRTCESLIEDGRSCPRMMIVGNHCPGEENSVRRSRSCFELNTSEEENSSCAAIIGELCRIEYNSNNKNNGNGNDKSADAVNKTEESSPRKRCWSYPGMMNSEKQIRTSDDDFEVLNIDDEMMNADRVEMADNLTNSSSCGAKTAKMPTLNKTATCNGGNNQEFYEKIISGISLASDFVLHDPVVIPLTEHWPYLTISLYTMSSSQDSECSISRSPLAYVPIFLPEVLYECSLTESRIHLEKFALKKSAADVKLPAELKSLSRHQGFDAQLCFGAMTLIFQWYPTKNCETVLSDLGMDDKQASLSQEFVDSSAKEQSTSSREDDHQWVSKSFQEYPLCYVCSKKIWLKSALQCTVCLAAIHKKCLSKAYLLGGCGQVLEATAKDSVLDSYAYATVAEEGTDAAAFVDEPLAVVNEKPPVTTAPLSRSHGITRASVQSAVSKRLANIKLNRASLRFNRSVKNSSDKPQQRSVDGQLEMKLLTGDAEFEEESVSNDEYNNLLNSLASGDDDPNDSVTSSILYTPCGTYNEHVIRAAKLTGKNLFSDIPLKERKEKINQQIDKMQMEINAVSNLRLQLLQEQKKLSAPDEKLEKKLNKLDETLQGLAVLMLHYCAGLQNCQENETECSAVQCSAVFLYWLINRKLHW
ncbi:PDZ domain-containing protein 8 [Trichinella pseudospiralis]|uniref:PDZ domain-containing protein 8 n=1 Tax=Trichinella pseudospiralis TaxID=6337 RepID=A0A0V1IYX5_TRIPS|nr:PDZ domain-containing protein 8 [Trichinella pseudospiralis]